MRITSTLFDAYLKCPIKCWLISAGDHATDNTYAQWVHSQQESYRATGIQRLLSETADGEYAISSSEQDLKATQWRLTGSFRARWLNLEADLHAVRRVSMEGQQKSDEFIPIRFAFINKIGKDDQLQLGFDAVVLSNVVGSGVNHGIIIHGTDHATRKINTSLLAGEVQRRIEQIEALLSSPAPPDLILNRHCAECEFQARCRREAMVRDDLSLLSGMTEKERGRHRNKGIFTVTQLSYTFRPRRTPKRAKNPAKPRYLALQALAIRESTVYFHGSPVLPHAETQVYLDIEGLPDCDFYYLIGALIVSNGRATFNSFWADTRSDEPAIFAQFAEAVSLFPDLRIFHFGDYETIALKRMRSRLAESYRQQIDKILEKCTNVLSTIYPHVYFPTYSNSLKEIGGFLGIGSAQPSTGLQSIVWRNEWEVTIDPDLKSRLCHYNETDCSSLRAITEFIVRQNSSASGENRDTRVGWTTEMSRPHPRWQMFARHDYVLEDLESVVKSAYFDYQREKVFVRTNRPLKRINKQHRRFKRTNLCANRKRNLQRNKCPFCRTRAMKAVGARDRLMIDLKFSKTGVKRSITHTAYSRYRCLKCGRAFSSWDGPRNPPKYGHGLRSWCVYLHLIAGANMQRVNNTLGDLFGIFIDDCEAHRCKRYFRSLYQNLYIEIRQSLLQGTVIHVDETPVNLRRHCGYVWVITSMDKVYYFYRPSREGSFLAEMLSSFRGVLISDFFTAYDSLPCGQQKCLAHFVRDIDDDLFHNPLDAELKGVAQSFGSLLRAIVVTIDKYGLKKRHLHKHKKATSRFLKKVSATPFKSELASKYKKRFEKSGEKMFTFLEHDGIPWNNTNAEHAIKFFAKHRKDADGRFTEASLNDYLLLASVFATCEFNNLNVLKFLMSGEATLDGLMRMAGGGIKTKAK
jgi:predicted RecB family nuclease